MKKQDEILELQEMCARAMRREEKLNTERDELKAKLAAAKKEIERYKRRLSNIAQMLIEEEGADGPFSAETVARHTVEKLTAAETKLGWVRSACGEPFDEDVVKAGYDIHALAQDIREILDDSDLLAHLDAEEAHTPSRNMMAISLASVVDGAREVAKLAVALAQDVIVVSKGADKAAELENEENDEKRKESK